MRHNKYEYDAFISHAVEDKIPIANELCAKLERAGLKIWYSGKELGIGDSIEKTIEKGLNRSRYGIVILSPTYLAKNWTIREFYTLLAKEIEEQKVILPVLYNITVDELKNKDLLMADRFAVNADRGIDFVVERLAGEIKKSQAVKTSEPWFSRMWTFLIISVLVNVAFLLKESGSFDHRIRAAQRDYAVTPVSYQRRPVIDQAFLGEMEGLFSRLNTCNCEHCRQEELPVTNVRYVPDNAQQTGAPAYSGQVLRTRSAAGGRGRKMTMAVVFQIEAETEARRQADDISLPEGDEFSSMRELNGPGGGEFGDRAQAANFPE